MTVYLNTLPTEHGIKLTFDDGRSAGFISAVARGIAGPVTYQFVSPDTSGLTDSPIRRTRDAAQYDALAWAEDDAL